MMNLKDRIFGLAQTFKLHHLLLIALTALYTGWIIFVINHDKPIDFYCYYLTSYGFSNGVNMYNDVSWEQLAYGVGINHYGTPYRYPPLTAELVWPLTLLSPRFAALIWLVATALAFAASAWLLGCSSQTPLGTPLALGLLVFFVPPLATLYTGQVNGFLLLALVFTLYAFAHNRLAWMGVGVAVGAMLKLIPIAHLAYLGWRRQWQAAWIGLIIVVVLLCLAVPLTGWSGLASYARNFLSLGLQYDVMIPRGVNQSLNGFFVRLLTASNERWYLANAPQLARWLWLSTALLLIAATAALCWPRGSFYHLFQYEFALVTTAVSLITPYTWYHQLSLLLIPFFVLTERAFTSPSWRWMLIPLIIGYTLTNVHGLAWHHLEFSPLLVSMPFYTTLMLWGLLAWVIMHERGSLR
jgi:hypothetical protein